MHPAWEQACEDVSVDGHISSLKRSSEESIASATTDSSASSACSHLSTLLPALGLGPLPDDACKGQFSGVQGQDGGGEWKRQSQAGPSPSDAMSTASTALRQDSAKTKEDSTNESCAQDLAEGGDSSARASSAAKHRGATKTGGASRGAFRFHEAALPAQHEAVVLHEARLEHVTGLATSCTFDGQGAN